ncbi:MAG TPA: hypothetical protein VD962_09060 [Rubricoccaceae bacterium]|nr:hypothetical protein [Rubricoccaceae bacterium]
MQSTDAGARAPYEQAREAFAALDTPDKVAFVLEATFDAVGQALRDTGRAFADAFDKVTSEDFFKGFQREAEATADAAAAAAHDAADAVADAMAPPTEPMPPVDPLTPPSAGPSTGPTPRSPRPKKDSGDPLL